jgi:hypothetical protein
MLISASALREMEKPNATLQARGIAGARYERTLFPVACKRLLGVDFPTYGYLGCNVVVTNSFIALRASGWAWAS